MYSGSEQIHPCIRINIIEDQFPRISTFSFQALFNPAAPSVQPRGPIALAISRDRPKTPLQKNIPCSWLQFRATRAQVPPSFDSMSTEEKKRDDFTLDIDDSESSSSHRLLSPVRTMSSPRPSAQSVTNSPMAAILSYCVSSILMTCTNKYILGGLDYNLNFFLLCVQVCDEIVVMSPAA